MFDFFKRHKKPESSTENIHEVASVHDAENIPVIDYSKLTGTDFEFLIRGHIEISTENFDKIMAPSSFSCIKTLKDNWLYYQVGEDEFSYSFEPPGIQMTFNDAISYQKAKAIADEVIENIRHTGQNADLQILSKNILYSF